MQKAKKVLNHFGYNESQFDISDVYTGHRKKTVNEIFEKIKEDPLKYYNSNETFEKIEKLKIDFDDIETSVKLIMDIINCLN